MCIRDLQILEKNPFNERKKEITCVQCACHTFSLFYGRVLKKYALRTCSITFNQKAVGMCPVNTYGKSHLTELLLLLQDFLGSVSYTYVLPKGKRGRLAKGEDGKRKKKRGCAIGEHNGHIQRFFSPKEEQRCHFLVINGTKQSDSPIEYFYFIDPHKRTFEVTTSQSITRGVCETVNFQSVP